MAKFYAAGNQARLSGAASTRRPEHYRFFTRVFLIWIVGCISVLAQSSGVIQGTVASTSGASLPNATVSIRSMPAGKTQTLLTNQQGAFSAVGLPVGRYEVTSSAPGFSSVTATARVEAGVTRTVNLVLQPQGRNNRVRSTSSGAGTTGGSVNAKTVRDLPSNGRDWTQAATLQAGVEAVRTQPNATNTSSGRGQRGFGAQISVSGGRPQQNNYIVDGISINDYANAAPGSVLGVGRSGPASGFGEWVCIDCAVPCATRRKPHQ